MTKATLFRFELRIIILVVGMFSWNSVSAQRDKFTGNLERGSIKQRLREVKTAKNDTNKVFLLNDLNELFLEEGAPEKAMYYGNEALKLSQKINFQRGTAITFTNLGHTYSYYFDNKNALRMYLNALHMNRKLKRHSAVIDTYVNLGAIYDDMANYSMALKYYRMALDAAPKDKNFDLLGDIHQNLGITFGSLGNHNEALNQHYKALSYYEKMRDKMGMADALNSLGNVYAEKTNYASSFKMYKASLNLYTKIEDKLGMANEYANIGILLTEQNKLDSVEYYHQKALVIYHNLDETEGLIITYNALGIAYYKMGDLKKCEDTYLTALEYALPIDDKVETAASMQGLARVYADSKKNGVALKNAQEALSISLSIGNKVSIRNSYDVLRYVESKAKNFEKAYDYQNLFIAYKDSINNEETTQKGMQIALSYSFQKKEDAARATHQRMVHKLNTNHALENQKKGYFIGVLILIIVSSLVVAFFARRAYNNRKRYSEVLANENVHKEMLLQEIHHRVNNSLQMISSLLSIQADSTENEEIRAYLHKSENRLQAMSVMHQMLHLGNSKLEVDMSIYFGEVLSFYTNLLESKPNVKLHVDVPSTLFHTKTAMPLALILNELITNSLKYAFPSDEGEISVSLRQIENTQEWVFEVNDNGIGFDENKVPSDTGSLGLSLVNLMTRQIDGELEVNTTNGTSTRIRFTQKNR